MASIVELNQMSNDKLEKTLEEAREEMFNPVSYTHLDVYKRQV